MIKAVQQFMLGTVMNNEKQTRETLRAIKEAGYDGVELCGFMIRPMGLMVRMLTRAAGMPVGKGGNPDWRTLIKESGLQVVSLHLDMGTLEQDAHEPPRAKSWDELHRHTAFWTPVKRGAGTGATAEQPVKR